jgi:hypothetical protein
MAMMEREGNEKPFFFSALVLSLPDCCDDAESGG